MMKDLDIIPECYVDTNLVEALLKFGNESTAGVNHQKGCNTVVKVMEEKFCKDFALGIIDKDKRQPSYVNECDVVVASEHIKLLKHKKYNHFIIQIVPEMDSFILACARSAQVDLKDYGLSDNLHEFLEETKKVATKNDMRFKLLFKAIQGVREMNILKELLVYLKTHKYDFNKEELVAFFE